METAISPELLQDMKRYVQSKEYQDKYFPDWESDSDEYYSDVSDPRINRFLQTCGVDSLQAVATGKRWLTMPSSAFIHPDSGYLSIMRKCADDINARAGQPVLAERQCGNISRFYNPTLSRSRWAIENIDKYDTTALSGVPVSERCVAFIINEMYMNKEESSDEDYQWSLLLSILDSPLNKYYDGISSILAYQARVERDYELATT